MEPTKAAEALSPKGLFDLGYQEVIPTTLDVWEPEYTS